MPDAGVAPRAAAARAAAAVFEGRSLDDALAGARAGLPAADQGLAAAMAYGVVREHRFLAALVEPLLRRPPNRLVHALILVGVFQLRAMRVPAHAAVHATVAAVARLGQPKARGLVNAVLRRYQRERGRLESEVADDPGVRSSHPDWLVGRLRADWPGNWRTLLAADNDPAPMTLRVNRRQGTRAGYLETLAAAGIDARAHPHAADAVSLAEPVPVDELPGFAEGRVSVQDAAAQLAAPLLVIEPGMRVLDACAAPGGKTAHCLELADCHATALDIDADRLHQVETNLGRVRLIPSSPEQRGETGAVLLHADATQLDDWWDGRPFDRILIDAPCTGTGVIRRHPDIKWLRRESDAAALANRQRAFLDALWSLLAPGGQLVYATCSVLRAEGSDVVIDFLAATPDAEERPIEADWGEAEIAGRRIAPGEAGMDGFYYACLAKRRPR